VRVSSRCGSLNTLKLRGAKVLSRIKRSDIYDKNLNFLIGSGASVGLLPTLTLKLKVDGTENSHTFETLATRFAENADITAHLFSCYIREIISPAAEHDPDFDILNTVDQDKAIKNYQTFLGNILQVLAKKKDRNRANIFTTNYDGMIAHSAEKMLQVGSFDFHVNDGGSGFKKRTLNAKNFNRYYQDHGVFDRHAKSVPQINLIQMHGSVYWYKDGDHIEISYDIERSKKRINAVPLRQNDDFDAMLNDKTRTDADVAALMLPADDAANASFQQKYDALPIVNPTKWKFHETVFEEHYYQMLRLLSYELEKPNSVFVAFGFSFADEHILNLVKRSLSNPSLHLYLCCYSKKTETEMQVKFKGFDNVELISLDDPLDFTAFNEKVFNSTCDEQG